MHTRRFPQATQVAMTLVAGMCAFVGLTLATASTESEVAQIEQTLIRQPSGTEYDLVRHTPATNTSSIRLRLSSTPVLEDPATCGTSHLIEHLIGNYVIRHGSELERYGFAVTGFTALDATMVGIDVGGGEAGLQAALDLLDRAFRNAAADQATVAYEAAMVRGERSGYDVGPDRVPFVFLSSAHVQTALEDCPATTAAQMQAVARRIAGSSTVSVLILADEAPDQLAQRLRLPAFATAAAPAPSAASAEPAILRQPGMTLALEPTPATGAIEVHYALPMSGGRSPLAAIRELVLHEALAALLQQRLRDAGFNVPLAMPNTGFIRDAFRMAGFRVAASPADVPRLVAGLADAVRAIGEGRLAERDVSTAMSNAVARLCRMRRTEQLMHRSEAADTRSLRFASDVMLQAPPRMCDTAAATPVADGAAIAREARMLTQSGSFHLAVRAPARLLDESRTHLSDHPLAARIVENPTSATPLPGGAARLERSARIFRTQVCGTPGPASEDGPFVASAISRQLLQQLRFAGGAALNGSARYVRSSGSDCFAITVAQPLRSEDVIVGQIQQSLLSLEQRLSAHDPAPLVQYCFEARHYRRTARSLPLCGNLSSTGQTRQPGLGMLRGLRVVGTLGPRASGATVRVPEPRR